MVYPCCLLVVVIAGMTCGFSALGTGYRVIGAKFNASSQFLKMGFGLRSFYCRDLALGPTVWVAKDCGSVKNRDFWFSVLNQ
jgi:hypothetical protein